MLREFYKDIKFDPMKELREIYKVTQGDTKSRGLIVTLILGDIVTPAGLHTMKFFAVKPDKTAVLANATIDGDEFIVDFTNQVLAVPGVVVCSLVLYGTDGEKIADKKFKLIVESSLEDGAVISVNERGILDRAFELAEDIVPRLELLDLIALEGITAEYLELKPELIQAKADAITATGQAITAKDNANIATGNAEAKIVDVEERFQSLTVEGQSFMEVIDARQGEASLAANLEGVKSQLALKTDRTYVDNLAASLANGSPKGVYATLALLQSAFPTGNANIYVVAGDGKWYYYNAGWIAGGIYQTTLSNDFPATNIVTNGNFATTTGWIPNQTSLAVLANECILTLTGITTSTGIYKPVASIPTGHKFYISAEVNPKYAGNNIKIGYTDALINNYNYIPGQYNRLSVIGTKLVSNNLAIYMNAVTNYVIGDTIKIKNVIAIDLTATFGVEKEPSVKEMEAILSKYPNSWFDGTISPLFSNKELYDYYKSNSVGKMPSPLRPDSTLTVAGGVPSDVSASGVVYGSNGNAIYKSSNYGVTTTTLLTLAGTLTPTVAWVLKMDNGSVVTAIVNRDLDIGEIWKSDINEANFAKVHTFITPKSKPGSTFGYSKFKNILLVAEYGADKSLPNNPRRAYMSIDSGATWTQVFEGLNVEGAHPHDIQYDPYEDIIWVVSGDGVANRLVWYTIDRGLTWKTIVPPVQYTNISVLPNCILFGTDTGSCVGFFRLDRPKSGFRTATNLQIVEAYIQTRDNPHMPIACKSYSDFNSGIVYSSFYETAPYITMPATIYATKDGYNFYIIWQSDTLPTATANGVGVLAIAGASSDGNLVAYVRMATNNTLRLTVPSWV